MWFIVSFPSVILFPWTMVSGHAKLSLSLSSLLSIPILSLSLLAIISMATTLLPFPCCKNYYSLNFTTPLSPSPKALHCRSVGTPTLNSSPKPWLYCHCLPRSSVRRVICKATEVSVAEESSASGDGGGGRNWVPVVPLAALPRGERRVIIQDGETILLLWYKDQVYAIENRSPAEGAYTEGLLNARLTQNGCIVCPTTDSTFDLRTGAIKEWYPKNPVLRVLTPALRTLFVYPVKTDEENIYISLIGGIKSDASAEIVFSGKAQPGVTATDVNVDEVKMEVVEDLEGFGFTGKNEIINGKAAVIGFLLLLDFELLTGKGLLKGTGFLDFIYSVSNSLN